LPARIRVYATPKTGWRGWFLCLRLRCAAIVQHGAASPDRANKIPLPPTEMTLIENERNPLIEAPQLNAKPTSVSAAHIRANRAGCNFAPVRMRPSRQSEWAAEGGVRRRPLRPLVSLAVETDMIQRGADGVIAMKAE
jgi:hypothetical protein